MGKSQSAHSAPKSSWHQRRPATMAKRRNENGQMRREEYEAQDSRDDDGITADSFSVGFERASESSIRQRKIVKARVGPRTAAKPASAAAAGGAGAGSAAPAASANPFGGFSGLTASQPPAASANPFAGFSGLTGASPAAPTPSFAPAPAPAASTPVPATFSTNGAPKASASSYQEAMEVLNKEFMTFVNSQAKESPSSSWIAAAQEYVTYANEIAKKHAATKPVPLEQQGKKSAAPAPFSFAPSMTSASPASAVAPKSPKESGFFSASKVSTPTKPKESMVPSFTSSASAPSFSFGAAKKDSTPSKETKSKEAEVTKSPSRFGGFSFGATSSSSTEETKTIPAFSFGAKPVFPPATSTTPSTSSSGFSFGNFSSSSTTPTSLPPASKPFSFGASAAGSSSTTASSGAGAPANDEEDEEQVGREEATVILKSDSNEEDDCTFDVDKAKVLEFKKDEKRWADKGVHPLKVLVNKETKAGRILVRNEIGKIVLNAALYKGITLKPHETKGKTTGVLLSLQADADAGLTQFIIKVNAAKVDGLISSLDKAANGGSS